MSSPIIGITISRTLSKYGYSLLAITEAYTQSISKSGASPVLIPLGLPEEQLLDIISRVDGILFAGGGDIHPNAYGSQMHPLVAEVDADRDRVEIFLAQQIIEQKMPFLGICRGIQLLNVAMGGTLWEDLEDQRPGSFRHSYFPEYPRKYLAHPVDIEPDSKLASILQKHNIMVNSLHHQGIRQLAPGLKPIATAPDGLVEAAEIPGYPFGVAVQWHPEWLPDTAAQNELFRSFYLATL